MPRLNRRRTAVAAPRRTRIALALAGGGPLGAIYEIGALCALQDALSGIDLTQLDHYVGVSAGGFMAAALANGLTPRELCAAFIENQGNPSDLLDPSWFMVPAYAEFARRAVSLPWLTGAALWDWWVRRKPLPRAMEQLGAGLPTGIFANDVIDQHLRRLFSQPGRTNDFRQLATRLTLVATNLDSGAATPFGEPGWDDVPISRAVQASAALPGLFPPVLINGQYYVDGALKKTMHASVALEHGADLLICLNPLVPFDASAPDHATQARGSDARRIPRIVEGGLPSVLSQTFRSIIHSRMALGMKHYALDYPQTDIVLIEPDQRDAELYLANTFSYSNRRQLAEHAYQQTLALLRTGMFNERLARHGLALRAEFWRDGHVLLRAPGQPGAPATTAAGSKPATTEVCRHLGRTLDQLSAIVGQLHQATPASSASAAPTPKKRRVR